MRNACTGKINISFRQKRTCLKHFTLIWVKMRDTAMYISIEEVHERERKRAKKVYTQLTNKKEFRTLNW